MPFIVEVKDQCAVDIDLFGLGVDGERIAGPDHQIGVLSGLQPARLVGNPQGLGRVITQPAPGIGDRNLKTGLAGVGQGLGRLLIQPLDADLRIRMVSATASAARS